MGDGVGNAFSKEARHHGVRQREVEGLGWAWLRGWVAAAQVLAQQQCKQTNC
jgi:hypothetical protein